MYFLTYFYTLYIQWNPVNTVTNGPTKFGRINGVATLTRVFLQENVWRLLPGGQKSGRNDEVTVLPRWPQGGVSLYTGMLILLTFYLLENARRSVETSFSIRDFYCYVLENPYL